MLIVVFVFPCVDVPDDDVQSHNFQNSKKIIRINKKWINAIELLKNIILPSLMDGRELVKYHEKAVLSIRCKTPFHLPVQLAVWWIVCEINSMTFLKTSRMDPRKLTMNQWKHWQFVCPSEIFELF